MFRTLTVLSVVIVGLTSVPLKQTRHFKIVPLSEANLPISTITERTETEDVVRGEPRLTVEYPWSGSVPNDYGGNFGDLEFYSTTNNGYLYSRDTVINGNYSQDVVVYYSQQISTSYRIEDVKFLNFGRQRGFVQSASFSPSGGWVEGTILAAAGNEVRIFVEIYVS